MTSSPSTPTFDGKRHWLLVIDNCNNYCCSFFLREKSDLAKTMLGLINALKVKFNFQVQCFLCNNVLRKPVTKKGWVLTLNIQPQVCLSKIGMLNASLLPYSTGYMPCFMVENLPPTYEAVYGQKLRTLPRSSRTT